MKTLLILSPILLLIVCAIYSQQYEDVVYLRNGSEIHGIIIEQVPSESIKIKTKDGSTFVYKMEEIEKMTKEEIMKKESRTTDSESFQKQVGRNYSGFGMRGGIGTDITLSLGFGVGAFYVLAPSTYSTSNWDLGLDIYYANVTEEETDSEGTLFEDNTELLVFAIRTNGLFNYRPKQSGVYFVAGVGIVLANISWEEDITYYYPYVPGTYHYSNDAFSIGNVFNLGVGLTFGGGLEARLETPLLIFYDTPGEGTYGANSIVPTFTLNLLYRF
jgi:hypothetical protein